MAGRAIFIGYRRDDTADVAGRIYDALASRFGRAQVFKDVDNLRPGVDFGKHIRTILPRCRSALFLIGPSWIDAKDEVGLRRIDNPRDMVRIEIETAFLCESLEVVPVLVNGARLPSDRELPSSLHPLLRLHAAIIRRDPDFREDVGKLAKSLQTRPGFPWMMRKRSDVPPRQTSQENVNAPWNSVDPAKVDRAIQVLRNKNYDFRGMQFTAYEVLRHGFAPIASSYPDGIDILRARTFGEILDELPSIRERWTELRPEYDQRARHFLENDSFGHEKLPSSDPINVAIRTYKAISSDLVALGIIAIANNKCSPTALGTDVLTQIMSTPVEPD